MTNARRYVGPIDDDKAITTKEYIDANTPPTISSGDSGKVLAVKSDESGTEWVDAPDSSAEILTVATIESYL